MPENDQQRLRQVHRDLSEADDREQFLARAASSLRIADCQSEKCPKRGKRDHDYTG